MSAIFKTQGGGGGLFASIFVKGLSETDTVYATKDGVVRNGVWTERANPEAVGLPDGYTELEYIKSTGTQYIDTGFSPNQDTRTVMRVTISQTGSEEYLFGVRPSGSSISGLYELHRYENAFSIGYNNGWKDHASYSGTMPFTIDFNKNNLYFNDNLVLSATYAAFNCAYPMYLFQASGNHGFAGMSAKMYECQIYDNETLARNYVPAKRNSDGTLGLYDTVNDVFYINAGTGDFVAGAEIPSTIDGFLISPLREFGTWTVTATNGTNTATQDVLVDVATEFEIFMDLYKLWLYREGDECEDVTGGWDKTWDSALWTDYQFTKNADNMSWSATGQGDYAYYRKTTNGIDIENVSEIVVDFDFTTTQGSNGRTWSFVIAFDSDSEGLETYEMVVWANNAGAATIRGENAYTLPQAVIGTKRNIRMYSAFGWSNVSNVNGVIRNVYLA